LVTNLTKVVVFKHYEYFGHKSALRSVNRYLDIRNMASPGPAA